ncbi:putative phage abortive infection protein, partial [Vibrio fluvialis]|uniref:putative phage abortive infection protein n=2 Tax=Vibrio fluvialis TaxID=676 RepID=UPI00192A9396
MYNRLKSIGKQLLAVAKQDWRRLKRIWKALPIRNQLIVRIAFYPVILISLLYLTISILGFFKIGEVSAWLGTFGDFVGGITNPIFSFLAFLGLLWTIKQQRDELGISREELRLTREELAKSADAQELHAQTAIEQQKLIQLQQFEATFFSLLANHEVALGKAIEDVKSAVNLVKDNDLSDECWHFNFHEYQGLVSYFIVLYQILKFVDESTLSSHEEKKKYTSLLRAYLPSEILILLTFNCYVNYKGVSETYN